MQRPSISVIVPALNEEHTIASALHNLLAEPHTKECIVVDGGSSDKTAAIVRRETDPRVKLMTCSAGRGRQMNAGAQAASGEMLLFHHADSRLAPGAMAALANHAADPKVLWGGFRHRFSQANWKLNVISTLHNIRFRLSGAVYGDQSMFVRTSFFEALGGFSEDALEDLLFSDKALEHSPPQRMRHPVTTDSRKFVQMGELRAFAEVVRIVLRYQFKKTFDSQSFFEPYR